METQSDIIGKVYCQSLSVEYVHGILSHFFFLRRLDPNNHDRGEYYSSVFPTITCVKKRASSTSAIILYFHIFNNNIRHNREKLLFERTKNELVELIVQTK